MGGPQHHPEQDWRTTTDDWRQVNWDPRWEDSEVGDRLAVGGWSCRSCEGDADGSSDAPGLVVMVRSTSPDVSGCVGLWTLAGLLCSPCCNQD